ncbi:protein of unknown function [Bacillus sp. OV166]|uniref:DUF4179 domain-containing protein n=1 Tax=Bacillus sp. OV166 TaxID=1882763 RepID=UPI000A2ADA81|nr:DUF4179 domain-containing protein [Bacillus sp. OV166]SMQ81034.1 protein of unknown function [Bacillus sp. OV166]
MKDIYQLLNDINLDDNEFVEMEVNEIETARVKKALKKAINEKKKLKSNIWKRNALVASILVCISATTFGLTFPAYAKNIPIIDDIFRFFDNKTVHYDGSKEYQSLENENGLYTNYKKFSTAIGLTKESNGIKITINDAIFDGKTLTLTYSIESKQELGNVGISLPEINGIGARSGTSGTSKIGTDKYVGILTVSNFDDTNLNGADIQWNIDSLRNPENHTEIKGAWKFEFSLNAANSKIQLTEGSSAEKNGVTVNIEKITFNPMSFAVSYNQEISEMISKKWNVMYVDLEIKDDLGNKYSGQGNGGFGTEAFFQTSKTFGKLDPNASKLIITPHIILQDKKLGKGNDEFVAKDIIIKIKK